MRVFDLCDIKEELLFAEKVLGSVGKGLDKIKVELTNPEHLRKFGGITWYDTTMLLLALEEYENRAEEHEYFKVVSLRNVLNRKSISLD